MNQSAGIIWPGPSAGGENLVSQAYKSLFGNLGMMNF
jgi:hypothetical protein